MLGGDRTSIKTLALCSIWRDRTNTESFVLLNCLVLTEVGRSSGRKMKSSEKALWGGWGIRFSQPEARDGMGRGQSLGCTSRRRGQKAPGEGSTRLQSDSWRAEQKSFTWNTGQWEVSVTS